MVKVKFVLLFLFTFTLFMATPVGATGFNPPYSINCDTGVTDPRYPGLGVTFKCVKSEARGVRMVWYGKDLPPSFTMTITYDQTPDRCDSTWYYPDSNAFDGIQGSCKLDGNKAIVSYPQLPVDIGESSTPRLTIVNFTNTPPIPLSAVVEGTLYDPGGGSTGPASIEDNVQTITDSVNADTEANDNIKNQDTTGDDYTLNSDHNQSLLSFLTSTVEELASVQPASNCDFDLPQPAQINESGTKYWRVDVCTYNPPGAWTTVLSAISAFFWLMAIWNLLHKVLDVNREAVS